MAVVGERTARRAGDQDALEVGGGAVRVRTVYTDWSDVAEEAVASSPWTPAAIRMTRDWPP
ncbi:hypothetical protein C3492_38115 [Streptomyces sp. Ru62]|uniref:hypothetical protein n=1 Tax=Streptomyces sp. Ru62 TaxID=2080745 RepID=UPI000CDD4ACF|nr:hypothetical protein [Streptomyces sp. Ru62]POX58440.1 hypothetical protein C3492_38115 [Streptomyces sp. Ru62]